MSVFREFDTKPTFVPGDQCDWSLQNLGTITLPRGRWTLGTRPSSIGPANFHVFPEIIAQYTVGGGKVQLAGMSDFVTHDPTTTIDFFQKTRNGDPDAPATTEAPPLVLVPADLVEPQNFARGFASSHLRPLGCNWVTMFAIDTSDATAKIKLRWMCGTFELDALTELTQGVAYTVPVHPSATSIRTVGDPQLINATWFKKV